MNINSSYYSVTGGAKNSTNKGLSGLASGMDTEAMVDKMLSGTQGKIDKQEALKQQAQWKQDIYRDTISSINEFYGKYFDPLVGSGLRTNFASDSFFNTMSSAIKSGNALKVISTGNSASTGDIRMAVKQLAANSVLKTEHKMSGDQKIIGTTLTDQQLTAQFNKQVSLKVGNQAIDVNLNEVTTDQKMVDAFQFAFKAAGVTGVSAKIYNGRLRFVTDDPAVKVELGADSTDLGLKMTGLGSAKTSELVSVEGNVIGHMLQGGQAQADAGYSFDLTLDGVQKSITLNSVGDASGKVTVQSLRDAVAKQVEKSFGGYVAVDLVGGDHLEFSSNIKDSNGKLEPGHEVTITGLDARKIGVAPGSSTHINTNTRLSELNLEGDRFTFTINDTEFKFTGDDSIGSVINTINTSSAGVRITYSTLSDTFKMESTSTGSKYSIKVSQQEGDVLGAIFGKDKVAAAGAVASNKMTTGVVSGNPGGLASEYQTASASMKMKVNGVNYTFALPYKKDAFYTKSDIETGLNQWLAEKFGSTGPDDAKVANISYKDGKLNTAKGFVVEFEATKVDTEDAKAVAEAQKSDLALAFGFNKTANSNVVTANTPLNQIQQLEGINPAQIQKADGTQATSLSEIATINGLKMTYSEGRLSLSGTGTIDLSAQPEISALFGNKKSVTLGDGQMSQGAVAAGQDAKVVINGVETTRSSNSFLVDGVTVELTQKSAEKLDAGGNVTGYEETVISTSRDTEQVVEGFKSFVKDYNAMIGKLNKYVSEDANYRTYPPLTAAQKKEMGEKEVALWEEKSKQGLVRNDDTINGFLSQMRAALYAKPENSKLSLYNIGIETSSYNKVDKTKNGELVLDETALRNALTADPDAVRTLFTETTDGLSTQLMTAMNNAAKQSIGSPGALVQLAGIKGGSTDANSVLTRDISNINDRIKELKYKYEKEKTRYWNQFNSMEQILANFNSQSAMITQQFGGM